MGTGKPFMQNELPLQIGMDPKSGCPINYGENQFGLKQSMIKNIRIMDEQEYINKITIKNCPPGINSQLIRRILYYRGAGILFFLRRTKRFMFLPFVMAGNKDAIDCYGRYIRATPIPMSHDAIVDSKDKPRPWIPGLEFDIRYDIVLPEEITPELMDSSCVILGSYSAQANPNKIIPRAQLIDTFIKNESDIFPFMMTALLNSTGVQAWRVNDSTEQSNVDAAAQTMYLCALSQQPWLALEGKIDFQTLTTGSVPNATNFLVALQSMENWRRQTNGIKTGGILEKQEHILQSEQDMNDNCSSLVLKDELDALNWSLAVANSIWGLGMKAVATEEDTNDKDKEDTNDKDKEEEAKPDLTSSDEEETIEEEEADDLNVS